MMAGADTGKTDGTLRNHLLAIVVMFAIAGCGGHEDQAVVLAPPTAPAQVPVVEPIAKGVPHGGPISEAAVTEQGDAALTFDSFGSVRLWPALDGTRTPVPLSLVAPKQLALSHAGRDLLAAVLDEAGAVDLLRFGRDGSLRGRVQLPAEVAYEQVLGLDDGVLVRAADHSIEWLSADGESRGKVVADPSHRIVAITARRGVALAITSDGATHQLRWLHLVGNRLAWGPSVVMPTGVHEDDVALSPSHRRIAIVVPGGTLVVYEIGLALTQVGRTLAVGGDVDIGFIDDDHVAVMNTARWQWWTAPPKPPAIDDPWDVPSTPVLPMPELEERSSGGAVADGLAVTGFGASLALLGRDRARYLGYRAQGIGPLGAASSSLWVNMTGSRVAWFDDRLALRRDIELRNESHGPWMYATPIGDRHVVTHSARSVVQLVDVDKPDDPITLGTYDRVDRIVFEPASGLLGIGSERTLHRFRLDLAANAVTPLPPLRVAAARSSFYVLDPARAGGAVAITVGWESDHATNQSITLYREDGTKHRIKQLAGNVIGVAADGTLYLHDRGRIETWRGTKRIASVAATELDTPMAVTRDGTRFAARAGHDIVVLDAHGAEQWRKTVWGASQLVFTRDGKQLAVGAHGGIVMLATETGERNALECGWSFELSTTPPSTNTLGAAPVCEDPTL